MNAGKLRKISVTALLSLALMVPVNGVGHASGKQENLISMCVKSTFPGHRLEKDRKWFLRGKWGNIQHNHLTTTPIRLHDPHVETNIKAKTPCES